MQKIFLFFFSFFFLLLNSASADLTVHISDIENKRMRVTYTHVADKAGKKSLEFPAHSFDFAEGPLDVISVKEIYSRQDLKYHLFKSPESINTGSYLESLKIDYPFPVPEEKEFKIEVTVEATTENIHRESEGRYIVTYETGHQLFFILPENYSIVYSNVPVLINEGEKNTIVQADNLNEEYNRRELIFKIQAFQKEDAKELDDSVSTEKTLESPFPVTLSKYKSKGSTEIRGFLSREMPLSFPYSIKLGSYRTLEKAQKAINAYNKKNLCSYWAKVDLKEMGEWYRIYTGHFETREYAESFINDQGLTESIVKRTPYAVLIDNYISLDELENKTLSLSQNGYSPYIIEDPKGIFRLFVGAFFNIDDTAKQCEEMKSRGIQCQIIKR